MVVSGLLAFVFIAASLRDRAATIDVVVAATDLPAGTALDTANTKTVTLAESSPLAGSMLRLDALGADVVTRAPLRAGEPILASQIDDTPTTSGLRAMSVPVERANAVGGDLRVGDRVDIADVDRDGNATWLVTGVQVIDVGADRVGLTGVDGSFYVVVDVDAPGALRLAAGLADGKVNVVRSTGADPITTSVGSGS
jgi:Flp pilus assembly protein CpaB